MAPNGRSTNTVIFKAYAARTTNGTAKTTAAHVFPSIWHPDSYTSTTGKYYLFILFIKISLYWIGQLHCCILPWGPVTKRPRGLDDLLGHLLVKRMPVTFQLSNTKIPEYLSQK